MVKRVLAILMTSLILVTVFNACFTASADPVVTIQGGVTFNGVGVIGATVKAVGGADSDEDQTGPIGFYNLQLYLKRIPTNIHVTAYKRFDEPWTKIISFFL